MPAFKSLSLFSVHHQRPRSTGASHIVKKDQSLLSSSTFQSVSLPNIGDVSSRFMDELSPLFRHLCKPPVAPSVPLLLEYGQPILQPVSTIEQLPRLAVEVIEPIVILQTSIAPQSTLAATASEQRIDFEIFNESVSHFDTDYSEPKELVTNIEACVGTPNEICVFTSASSHTLSGEPRSKNELFVEVARLHSKICQLKRHCQYLKSEVDMKAEELIQFKGDYYAEKAACIKLSKKIESIEAEMSNFLILRDLELSQAKRFISAMIAINLHEPVLRRAYKALQDGKPADAALVASIRQAAARDGTPWATIIPAIVGERPPELYLDVIKRSSKMERMLHECDKKYRFWKMKAQMNPRHKHFVTPSSSSLSVVLNNQLINEDLELGCLDTLLDKLKAGKAPMRTPQRGFFTPADRGPPSDVRLPIRTYGQPTNVQTNMVPLPMDSYEVLTDVFNGSSELSGQIIGSFPAICDSSPRRFMLFRTATDSLPISPVIPDSSSLSSDQESVLTVKELTRVVQHDAPARKTYCDGSGKTSVGTPKEQSKSETRSSSPANLQRNDTLEDKFKEACQQCSPSINQTTPIIDNNRTATFCFAEHEQGNKNRVLQTISQNADARLAVQRPPFANPIHSNNSMSSSTTSAKRLSVNSSILAVPPVLRQSVVGGLRHIRHISSSLNKTEKEPPTVPEISHPRPLRTYRRMSSASQKENKTARNEHMGNDDASVSTKRHGLPAAKRVNRPTVSSALKTANCGPPSCVSRKPQKQGRRVSFELPSSPKFSHVRRVPPSDVSANPPISISAHRKMMDQGRKAVKTLAKFIA
ncbi:hypothetical protein AX17_001099 [Amanita inopinata Kibby_2008]|nr:hypothetical protein AX17_001099 [Amanita inopinata Kibby_2008]